MLQTLIYLLVILFVIGIVWWIIDYIPVPQPLNKWAKVIVILMGALILISVLLSLAGVNLGLPR